MSQAGGESGRLSGGGGGGCGCGARGSVATRSAAPLCMREALCVLLGNQWRTRVQHLASPTCIGSH